MVAIVSSSGRSSVELLAVGSGTKLVAKAEVLVGEPESGNVEFALVVPDRCYHLSKQLLDFLSVLRNDMLNRRASGEETTLISQLIKIRCNSGAKLVRGPDKRVLEISISYVPQVFASFNFVVDVTGIDEFERAVQTSLIN